MGVHTVRFDVCGAPLTYNCTMAPYPTADRNSAERPSGPGGVAARLTGHAATGTRVLSGALTEVALQQLFPLLVHAVLFGRGHAEQALAAAESALRGGRS